MSSEHLDDDALSASLDGEATVDEVAHLDGCEACRTRLAELRSAANLIGSPVPPADAARREAAVADALLALPTPIRRTRRAVPPWVLAAAAIFVVAVALVPILSRSSGGHADTNASADSSGRAELKAAAPSADQSSGAATAPFATATEGGPDLGVFGTDEQLRDRILAALPDAPAATTTTAATATRDAPACAQGSGTLVLAATATIGDTPARVFVYDLGDGQLRAVAVAVDDCRELRSETFAGQ